MLNDGARCAVFNIRTILVKRRPTTEPMQFPTHLVRDKYSYL